MEVKHSRSEPTSDGAPDGGMAHIAIQEALDGKVVEWMEKVTDEEYAKAS